MTLEAGRSSSLEGNEVHLAEESVHASVGLTTLSHEAGQSECFFLSIDLAILVNLKESGKYYTYIGNFDLH